MRSVTQPLCLSMLVAVLVGCVTLGANQLAGSLSQAVLNQDDPETVRSGAPAYLLLLDGFIEENPEDPFLLTASARLHGAYATVFVDDTGRAQRLTSKARDYARRALCLRHDQFCDGERRSYGEFVLLLSATTRTDLPALYTFAATWAQWIQVRRGEYDALADLPKVEAMMERVIELEERFEQGQPHLYLAVMRTQLPPAMGGRPEQGRLHFLRSIELSEGRDLMAKVEFARLYARLVFDRSLHDRLLKEVLAADPVEAGLTLSNTLAQREAHRLLETSQEYFEE